jgi:hypothetical protein
MLNINEITKRRGHETAEMRFLKSFRRTQNDCHKRNEDMRVELEITFEK